MTANKLMTMGAVAFAGFAAWYALKNNRVGILPVTGEQQRMQGVADWLVQNQSQEKAIEDAIWAAYVKSPGAGI